MKKEIGGYLELEELAGEEYYPELYHVNLGRTALLWLMESRGYRRLLLPYYLCDSVIDACKKNGICLEFYTYDEELQPQLEPGLLPADTALYLVNYYGQLTNDRIRRMKKIYGNIIVDHTQAFYQRPLPGVDTLYSVRKFFGVSDGAYLATDAVLKGDRPEDRSRERLAFVLGRYETDAGTYYQRMLENAETYHNMEIRRMSRLTRTLLKAVDYKEACRKRDENYHILKELLPSENPFTRIVPDGPYAYPYYCKDGLKLRRWLAERKIYVSTNWKNVVQEMPEDSREYDWAANILPLPCDQRYGREEMEYIAESVREWEREQEQRIQHRLLILGSLGEFTEMVRLAKSRGIYTIVCDGYPDGPARAYADEDYVIPVTEHEKIAALCREKQADGIITSFSDLLLECMVHIADLSGLPCYLKPRQLPWYRDKSAARQLLKELGLPSPGFCRVSVKNLAALQTPEDAATLTKSLRYPLVTKPLDKYGSRGIYVVFGPEEIKEKGLKAADYSDQPEILLEEYNDGYEFNMMTWVLDGEVRVISIADREKTAVARGEIPISTRNVYPSRLYDQVEKPARELLQSYVNRTGQRDGALSMQFFWKPGEGIQVCEIAARFFGYEHELTDIVYGFKMEELLLNAVYDRPALKKMLDGYDPKKPECCGAVLYFQGCPGTICDQQAAYELTEHPAVIKPWIFYKEGEPVIEHGPNPYLALYYVQAEDRDALDKITEEFFKKMRITGAKGERLDYPDRIPDYPEDMK